MKTAIYIEDGTVQLVITPESSFEKDAMRMFGEGQVEAKMFCGSFYDSRGGWVRQSELTALAGDNGDRSVILRLATPRITPAQ
jgi:hypothetical protein